jgi:hypothetical protein
LTDSGNSLSDISSTQVAAHSDRVMELPLRAADTWEQVLAILSTKR